MEGQGPRRGGGCWAKAALLSFQEMLRAAVKARDVAFFFQFKHVFFKNIILPHPHPTTNFRIRSKPSYCPLFLLGKYYIYSRCRSESLQTSDGFRKTNLL